VYRHRRSNRSAILSTHQSSYRHFGRRGTVSALAPRLPFCVCGHMLPCSVVAVLSQPIELFGVFFQRHPAGRTDRIFSYPPYQAEYLVPFIEVLVAQVTLCWSFPVHRCVQSVSRMLSRSRGLISPLLLIERPVDVPQQGPVFLLTPDWSPADSWCTSHGHHGCWGVRDPPFVPKSAVSIST